MYSISFGSFVWKQLQCDSLFLNHFIVLLHLFIHSVAQANEFGGYFIVNGIERCIRMLQIPRRNYATAIQRSNYKNRGSTYTDLGVVMRSSRYNQDQSSITNTIHYLTTGGVTIKFIARKQEFLIPIIIIIRALSGGGDCRQYVGSVHHYTRTCPALDDADMAAGGSVVKQWILYGYHG